MSSPAEPRPRSALRAFAIAATCTAAMVVNNSNNTSVAIALPRIGMELHVPEAQLQWLVSAYPLSSGCLLLFFGRLADVHGRKRAFVLGSAVLAAFTLACGFASDEIMLAVLRGLQGVGGAATIPASLGTLAHAFPVSRPRSRALAFASFAAGGPIGAAIGMVLGALLTQLSRYTWRAQFFLSAALTFATLVAGVLFIPSDTPPAAQPATNPASSSSQPQPTKSQSPPPTQPQPNNIDTPIATQSHPESEYPPSPPHPAQHDIIPVQPDIPDTRMDWPGAFLSTAGLVLLIFVLGQGEVAGPPQYHGYPPPPPPPPPPRSLRDLMHVRMNTRGTPPPPTISPRNNALFEPRKTLFEPTPASGFSIGDYNDGGPVIEIGADHPLPEFRFRRPGVPPPAPWEDHDFDLDFDFDVDFDSRPPPPPPPPWEREFRHHGRGPPPPPPPPWARGPPPPPPWGRGGPPPPPWARGGPPPPPPWNRDRDFFHGFSARDRDETFGFRPRLPPPHFAGRGWRPGGRRFAGGDVRFGEGEMGYGPGGPWMGRPPPPPPPPPAGWGAPYIIALLILSIILLTLFALWELRLERAHPIAAPSHPSPHAVSAAPPTTLTTNPTTESSDVPTASKSAHNTLAATAHNTNEHGSRLQLLLRRAALYTPPPLLRPALFARAGWRVGAMYGVAMLQFCAFMGWAFWVQLYYQAYIGYSPLRTVVRLVPMFVSGLVCNGLVAVFIGRIPVRWFVAAGTLTTTVAPLLFALVVPSASYWAFGFPAAACIVVGTDFVFAAGTLFIAGVCAPEEQSVAGGVFQTMTQIGTSLGVTASTIVFNQVQRRAARGLCDELDAYHAAMWMACAFGVLATLVAVVFLRGSGTIGKDQPSSSKETEKDSRGRMEEERTRSDGA